MATPHSRPMAISGGWIRPLGRLEYATDPVPQYQYSPPGAQSWTTYTIFVTPEKATMECSITNAAGLRFDYLTENKNVLVTTGSRAVVLDSTFRKQQAFFDTKLNKPTSVLSVFLPEGLRLANLPGPGPSYVEMNPVWPEKLQVRHPRPLQDSLHREG